MSKQAGKWEPVCLDPLAARPWAIQHVLRYQPFGTIARIVKRAGRFASWGAADRRASQLNKEKVRPK